MRVGAMAIGQVVVGSLTKQPEQGMVAMFANNRSHRLGTFYIIGETSRLTSSLAVGLRSCVHNNHESTPSHRSSSLNVGQWRGDRGPIARPAHRR